jgi:hypothetical protein
MVSMAGVANATSMAQINLSGGTIQIGDKVFGDFSVSGVGSAVNLTSADVNIELRQQGDTVFIDFNGPFVTGTFAEIALRYSVTSLGGLITGIDQLFNLAAFEPGGIVLIGETVFDVNLQQVAQSSVGFNIVGDFNDPVAEPATGDQLVIQGGRSKLFVTKDIFLDAYDGGLVGATIISQSFHQVPEPLTVTLIGAGLCGLVLLRRRAN